MAEYGYTSGDYTTSSRMFPRTEPVGMNYGAEMFPTEPVGMNYRAAKGPVTVDGRGKTQPVIYFPDSYGTKPFVEQPEHKYSSPANRWGRPSSPVHDRDSQRTGEFFTKIQTEVSQSTRSPPNSTMDWRQPPYSTGHNGSSGYGGYSEYSKNDSWNRPSGSTIRNDGFDDYHRRNDRAMEVMNTSGGWGSRPNSGGWSATSGSSLTKPTNNIGEAVETLKEAATSTFSRQGGSAPVSAGPRYAETTDSMDAARRYGNFKLTSRSPKSVGFY